MIRILILINLGFLLAGGGHSIGCSNQESSTSDLAPDASISGQEEDPDPSVVASGGPEVLSVYPPSVDPDQDNVPDGPIVGHPEIKIDNCPSLFNPDQADQDSDGQGDLCDRD